MLILTITIFETNQRLSIKKKTSIVEKDLDINISFHG
jgi:hypothetical protein